jgi:hypothetical protein
MSGRHFMLCNVKRLRQDCSPCVRRKIEGHKYAEQMLLFGFWSRQAWTIGHDIVLWILGPLSAA